MPTSRPTIIPTAAFLLIFAAISQRASAQGCIASPNNPCSHVVPGEFTNTMSLANQWLGSVDYRWYESFRHFKGDIEQPQREAQGNNVINDVHSFNVSATYGFSDRWSAAINFPFIYADRSSLYEHDFTHRHTMHAGGLGDIRIVTDLWLLEPHKHMDGNIALGIGVKAPSGDDKASDISYRATGPVTRPVDPSIQPGDGGWGLALEVQAYQKVFGNLFAFVQGSYLITPEEQNDTETPLGDRSMTASVVKHDSIPGQLHASVLATNQKEQRRFVESLKSPGSCPFGPTMRCFRPATSPYGQYISLVVFNVLGGSSRGPREARVSTRPHVGDQHLRRLPFVPRA